MSSNYGDRATGPSLRPQRRSQTLLYTAAAVVVLAGLAFLFLAITSKRYEVLQVSMEPTLHEGDYVVATPWLAPGRGRLIVAISPVTGDALIKRIVGLPGETVEIHDGSVWIDGNKLDEPYLPGAPNTECRRNCTKTLTSDQYYVLGDNRPHSNDSRVLGPIAASDILYTIVLRYLPLDQVTVFP